MSDVAKQTEIQTLILSKERFETREEATRWVRDHDFRVKQGAPDETEDSWRYRQREPSEFQAGSFRTITLTEGVKAVIGRPKEERRMSKIEFPVTLSVSVGLPSEVDSIPIMIDASTIPDVEVAKVGELFPIRKQEADPATDDVRMIGIVSKPEVPDSEGSVISAQEIRQANDLFMREFGTIGFMHQKAITDKVRIIQNVIAPVDFAFPLPGGGVKKISEGTWYQELWTDDPELVGKIRKGEITGLSIGGYAKKVPVK